jgi:hypothetical protein
MKVNYFSRRLPGWLLVRLFYGGTSTAKVKNRRMRYIIFTFVGKNMIGFMDYFRVPNLTFTWKNCVKLRNPQSQYRGFEPVN